MAPPSIDSVGGGERPQWSVMIPAWNAEALLARTIDSVLAADLPEGSQVEVVDDCSTDGTAEIASGYAERGVRYHRHDSQHGASANFNACVRRARGEIVHILHADDEVVSGFYTAVTAAMADENIVAAVCRAQYIDEAGTPLKATRSESPSGVWDAAADTLAISNRIRPPAIAVRRSAYEAIGGFREDLPHAADWEMWVRLARHGAIWFQDAVLARYRVHPDQHTSQQIKSGQNIADRLVALQIVNDGFPKSSLRKGLLYSAAFAGRTGLQLMKAGEWRSGGTQLKAAARCAVAGLVGSTVVAGAQDS